MSLTAKQKRFVTEYMIDLNATQAAIRAGYAKSGARTEGARLLTNADIAADIAARQLKLAAKLEVSRERIVAELARIGFSDIRKAVRWNGSLIREEENSDGGEVLITIEKRDNRVLLVDSEDLDDDTAAAIAEISQNAQGGVKIKLHDKRAALVDLGKHLGMFVEKHEHSGQVALTPTIVFEKPDANRG